MLRISHVTEQLMSSQEGFISMESESVRWLVGQLVSRLVCQSVSFSSYLEEWCLLGCYAVWLL
jgi:hypothetical protein